MKGRKEGHSPSEPGSSSTYGSQSLVSNPSKSPKQRKSSIFHKLSSLRRGSVDPTEHLNGQECSRRETESASDVASSRTKMHSSKEKDNDHESACTPSNHILYTSESHFRGERYRENHLVVDAREDVLEHSPAPSIFNCDIRWRAPESWGCVNDLELNHGPPPPLSSFEPEGTDVHCSYETARHGQRFSPLPEGQMVE